MTEAIAQSWHPEARAVIERWSPPPKPVVRRKRRASHETTPRSRQHPRQQLRLVLHLVDERKRVRAADVRDALGCSMSTAWSLLRALHAAGELEQHPQALPRGGVVRWYVRKEVR